MTTTLMNINRRNATAIPIPNARLLSTTIVGVTALRIDKIAAYY
jgi:hypothetical protein